MLKKHPNIFVYLGTSVSCFLISLGLCILVNSGFSDSLSGKEILWQVSVASIVMTLLLFHRLTTVLFGVLGAAGVVYFAYTLKLFNIEDIAAFFEWCISLMPSNSPWYSAENLFFVYTFINIGICYTVFSFGKLPYRSAPAVAICIALICVVYMVSFSNHSRISMLLIFVGVFSFCAIDKFERHKHYIARNKFSIRGKRIIVPAFSIIMCLSISGSALMVFNNNKSYNLRNLACSNIAADVQSYTGVYTEEQKEFGISLYDLGLQANEDYVGGDLPDGEHFLLATTDLDSSFPVKVTTFDTFTKNNWTTSFRDNYRINGPFAEEQKKYLLNNILDKSSDLSNIKNVIYTKKVNVVLKIDSPFLLTTGQLYEFKENSKTINPNLFNSSGQLFSYFGQAKGYSYTLDTVHFKTEGSITKKELSELGKLRIKRDSIYTKEFVNMYTKNPFKFGKSINEIIKDMELNPKDTFETACKVCSFFSEENGFSYSTTGLNFDNSNNVVNEVFTNKNGHCVYYSTAAIAILREMRIPCRLAAGFRTVPFPKLGQIVDSYYPYCWVECYFPNLGWVSFDPSPENEMDLSLDLSDFPQNESALKENAEDKKDSSKAFDISKLGKIVFVLICIIIIIAALYLIVRGLWAPKLYNYDFVKKRFDTSQKQCRFYLKDIERQLVALGLDKSPSITLRKQVLDACELLENSNQEILLQALNILEGLCYGNMIPSEQEILQIVAARFMLEKTLRSKLNVVIYTIKRRMLIPVI